MVEALGTGSVFGEVGQPVSFVDGAIGLGLSITEDANRLPAQAVPRIKVIGIPHFNPIPTTAEPLSGSRLGPSLLGLMPQLGQVGLQPGQHRQSQVCGSMQEGSGGIEAIGYDVIGKAGSQQLDGPLQQPLASRILAVAWAVGLDIEGQRQSGAHHTDQAEVVIMANDLMVWVQHRVTELASGLRRPSRSGAVQRQADAPGPIKGFVAFGSSQHLSQRLARRQRVQAFGEVSQGVVSETAPHSQRRTRCRTHQRLHGRVGNLSTRHANCDHNSTPAGSWGRVRPSPGARK
jgi:hypothetical protein